MSCGTSGFNSLHGFSSFWQYVNNFIFITTDGDDLSSTKLLCTFFVTNASLTGSLRGPPPLHSTKIVVLKSLILIFIVLKSLIVIYLLRNYISSCTFFVTNALLTGSLAVIIKQLHQYTSYYISMCPVKFDLSTRGWFAIERMDCLFNLLFGKWMFKHIFFVIS